MIMNHFTHFFICPGSQNHPWDTPFYKEQANFLVNLKVLRQRGNEDVYEFITTTLKSKKGKDEKEAILTKSEEDPRYKKVIQFVGQPDLWTILEDDTGTSGHATNQYWQWTFGGTRRKKTRKRHCRTRRFRKN
jgi:hypothetical protein